MKTLDIKIDTSTNEATNFQDEIYKSQASRRLGKELSTVNGDVALLALHFQDRTLAGVLQDLDLSGALALRVSLIEKRVTGATILSFQDVFNQGDIADNENLSEGKLTFRMDHPATTLDSIIADPLEFVGFFYEFTWLSPEDQPQTLAQITLRIYAQADIGAAGTPPPSEPVYMTSATALATFVLDDDYLDSNIVTADGAVSPVRDGWQRVFMDADVPAATLIQTLPSAAGVADETVFEFINLSASEICRITPDGTDEINGVNGSVDFSGQFTSLIVERAPAGVTQTDWVVVDTVIP